jgi:PKD repeat protein
MMDQVTVSKVQAYDGGLSGEWPVNIGGSPYTIATRYSRTTTPIEKATQYAYERFTAFGLPAAYHEYNLTGTGLRRNVIAEQAGLSQPERLFLITAHLDSTSGSPNTLAPGADDNASGSTAVLLAAEILSQYTFDCTLRYVLFTGEEQGLYGSEAYAQQAFTNGDDIEAVLNLDMIAYNSDAFPILDLHTRPPSNPGNVDDMLIASLFVDVISAYNLSLSPQIFQDGISYSDHYSFWQVGYPAILAIEDDDDFTPYYHTINDRLNTLDLNYFTKFVKAAVGTLAHMGCLTIPGALNGVVTNAETSAPVAGAWVTAALPTGKSWSTSSGANGSYQLTLPAGTFNVTAQAAGYLPYAASGINVVSNQTTHLDIPLPVCHPVQGLDFIYSPASPAAGEPITFTAAVSASGSLPVTYGWYFGDGVFGNGQVITHTYPISDVYNVTVSASNCAGGSARSHPVQVTGYPEVQLSAASITVTAEPGAAFTQSLALSNAGGSPLVWDLSEQPAADWLDGSPLSGQVSPYGSQEIQLGFYTPPPGIYTTTLQLASNDPDRPILDIPVALQSACSSPGGVAFSLSPAVPWAGGVITFTGTTISGTLPVSFGWDFGDGGTGSGQIVTHTYTSTGSYPVLMTASNCAGDSTASLTLPVASPPRLELDRAELWSVLKPQAALTRTLQLTNTGGVTLTWSLVEAPQVTWLQPGSLSGSTGPGKAQLIEFTFTAPGSQGAYTTTLWLSSTDPSSPAVSIPVTLTVTTTCLGVQQTSLDFTPATPHFGEPVTFLASTNGGIPPLSYTWDFGDFSAPAAGLRMSQVAHSYPPGVAPRGYTVSVTILDACGVSTQASRGIIIWPYRSYLPLLPVAGF